MQLSEALRTTGSMRTFDPGTIADDVLYDLLDEARFAPSGGNRQPWRVIVVHDDTLRRSIRDQYLDAWHDYVAHQLAGLVPFSPVADEHDRELAAGRRTDAVAHSRDDGFAESLDTVPAMLVVCARLDQLAATDRDLDRYSLVGGASIYPFVWSIILAARERGLGAVMTTVATRNEPQLLETLHVDSGYAIAAIVALGQVRQRPAGLRRRTVESFSSLDTFDGPALERHAPRAAKG